MADTVPPLTADDLERDLLDLDFAAYWYIGKETDRGWKFARTAFALIPRLRIFLIEDHSHITKWVADKKPAAIAFGFDDTIHSFLNKKQAEDLQFVLDTIMDAMQPQ
jgi:hypothetical protein